jgi:hypothetical protein
MGPVEQLQEFYPAVPLARASDRTKVPNKKKKPEQAITFQREKKPCGMNIGI